MSTTRDHGIVWFECDTCSDTLDTQEEDFGAALAVLRLEGWTAYPMHGTWEHKCAKCRLSWKGKKR